MSELSGDQNKARMAAALLLTLPGSPFLYYGEELGMLGRKPDEYIREPFLWGGQEQAVETHWIESKYSRTETVEPAARQIANPASLLNHYRSLIALRNSNTLLRIGDIDTTEIAAENLVSFLRTHESGMVWVLHNLASSPLDFKIPDVLQEFTEVIYRTRDDLMQRNGWVLMPAYSTVVFGQQ